MIPDLRIPGIWGIACVAGVLVALALFVRRRRRVARAIGDSVLISRLAAEDLTRTPWRRIVPVALAVAALAAALTDPRWGRPEEPQVTGGPVILILDASSSMLAEDLVPNRLERQRSAARRVARDLEGAPVGIVVFAGRAYAVSPPTVDPGAVQLYLDAVDPGMVTQTGSSLAAAIRQGLALLIGDRDSDRGALVLISDGDGDEDSGALLESADLAARAGVPVFTLGAATTAGAPIPDFDFRTGAARGYKRRSDGTLIVSRLGEVRLRQVAERTGGLYAPLTERHSEAAMAAAIRTRSVHSGGGAARANAPARYGWFASAALFLLLLELGFATRPRRPA